MSKTKTEEQTDRKQIINDLCQDLSALEAGMSLFDTNLPTLGEEIDIMAVDKIKRLVIISVAVKPIAPQTAAKTVMNLQALWNFVCDFRADFYTEAKERKDLDLALRPPRIMFLVPNIPDKLWPYLNIFKESHIKLDIFVPETKKPNGDGRKWEKLIWPEEIKPLGRALVHRFDLENTKLVNSQVKLWERLVALDPVLAGYDEQKSLAKALDRLSKKRKGD